MNTRNNRVLLFFCLFLLYMSWGSTYLVTSFALEYAPGLSLAALRMTLSGVVLLIFTRIKGEKFIFTKADFKNHIFLGFFLVFLASALIMKGQETVSSGTTAMILGIVPTLMILSDWYFDKIRPCIKQIFGIAVGFSSIVWMQWYQGNNGQTSIIGFSLIFISALGWIYGSHMSTHLKDASPMSIFRSTGFIMLFGGLESLIFAVLIGENIAEINLFSPLLFILCIHVLLNIVGYVSYFWLLKNTRPMIAISYEFVNPVIALFLGWLFAGESVDLALMIACVFLVSSAFFAIAKKHDR